MSAWLPHGSAAWFHMAGTLMCEAAARAGLPPNLDVSLVERYIDGVELSPGLVQGLRFDIKNGQPSFRVGAALDEHADITVEVTAAASHELNRLYSNDPRFEAALTRLKSTGDMRVQGDLPRLGNWFGAVHDPIVDRTI
jgi:hypothetical protein